MIYHLANHFTIRLLTTINFVGKINFYVYY